MSKKEQQPEKSQPVSIFGSKTGSIDKSLSSLFNKPSAINRTNLIASKQRTIIEIPKGESTSEEEDEDEDENMEDEDAKEEVAVAPKETKLAKKQREENYDLESNYMNKLLDEEEEEAKEVKSKSEASDSLSDSEETSKTTKTETKAKTVDLKDSELEKAERTVFVGNLPSSVLSSKKNTKDLKNLFKLHGPLESIRFRSLNIDSNMPRKAAFISKQFKENETVNAYIVFKNKADSLKSITLNGFIYLNNHLRVDHLTHPLKQDNKLSIFVGNLDFEEHEESLWKFFNDSCKITTDEGNIISNVRIIRDSKTNFGKGFAIVQFIDSNHVEKALLQNGKKLKSSSSDKKGRDLRISRCKNTQLKNKKDNAIKQRTLNNKNMSYTDKQKTIIGRGKKLLNKSDRSTIGKVIIEGERSKRGEKVRGIKNGVGSGSGVGKKKPRNANSRAARRSAEYKKKLLTATAEIKE